MRYNVANTVPSPPPSPPSPSPSHSQALPSAGTDTFKDFDFDRKGDCKSSTTRTDTVGGGGDDSSSNRGGCQQATFPNPETQLLHYHEDLHFKFGGIRKPRLGNKANLTMARSKGWTIGGTHAGGAAGGSRNLNYSNPGEEHAATVVFQELHHLCAPHTYRSARRAVHAIHRQTAPCTMTRRLTATLCRSFSLDCINARRPGMVSAKHAVVFHNQRR